MSVVALACVVSALRAVAPRSWVPIALRVFELFRPLASGFSRCPLFLPWSLLDVDPVGQVFDLPGVVGSFETQYSASTPFRKRGGRRRKERGTPSPPVPLEL
jgi:hypothetical protein